jgi:hypothetical protein
LYIKFIGVAISTFETLPRDAFVGQQYHRN